jgi:DNA primase small subunit
MSLAWQSFRQYYLRLGEVPLSELPNREFGFIFFDRPGMVRHKQFSTVNSLKYFLRSNVPLHVYHSSALYHNPTAEMRDKGLISTDLIFDIDADHLETPCNKMHDVWLCLKCKRVGNGKAPEKCPQCGSEKISSQTWICEQCLETAKEHTIRLINILQEDFGISKKDISVFFSGHRGYHVHVTSDEARLLGSDERRELADYISATGMSLQYRGFQEVKKNAVMQNLSPPFGWNLRVLQGVKKTIETNSVENLVAIGLRRKAAETIFSNKQRLKEAVRPDRPWPFLKGVGAESWKKIVAHVISQQASIVDSVVTVDLHRLIRMPQSLHGKTGLKVSPVENIDSFEPLTDAVAFKEGTEKVHVINSQPIKFSGVQYAAMTNVDAVLPTGLALLLILKGNAVEVKK